MQISAMATKLTVVEVVASGNGTGVALAAAHGEELLEGARSGDGRLVGAGVGALLVGGTVGADRANLSDTAGARVEATVALDDVVLSLGAVGPAVDCEVGAAVARVVGGRVVDGAGRTSRPADANDDVGAPAPLGREGTGTEAVLETSGLTVVVLDLGVQG